MTILSHTKISSHAKITDFDNPLLRNEKIGWFDISNGNGFENLENKKIRNKQTKCGQNDRISSINLTSKKSK